MGAFVFTKRNIEISIHDNSIYKISEKKDFTVKLSKYKKIDNLELIISSQFQTKIKYFPIWFNIWEIEKDDVIYNKFTDLLFVEIEKQKIKLISTIDFSRITTIRDYFYKIQDFVKKSDIFKTNKYIDDKDALQLFHKQNIDKLDFDKIIKPKTKFSSDGVNLWVNSYFHTIACYNARI